MPENWFGDEVAATYDDTDADMFVGAELARTVDFLAALAPDGGKALELAIGTGRVAVPLAARGVHVSGIELSEAMVARLRAKDGGDSASIPVAIGDMATTRLDDAGGYDLAYLVFNTIGNLTGQDAQVDCFANAAAHLRPGGVFVVETGVPELRKLPPGSRFVAFEVTDDHVGVDEYWPATQRMTSHHTTTRHGVVRRLSVPFRFVWPAELDLMARLAGMRLRERWSDWSRAPFDDESGKHVSVWEKA
jgi:SAM-dependent methyltransferase